MSKVMVVTGGGRGIGAAIAVMAAGRGYAVCVNYLRDRKRAEEIAAKVVQRGQKAVVVQADVAREEDVLGLFKTVDESLGPLSVLVNSAGISGSQGRLDTMKLADLRAVFEINVYGTFLCSREAILRMSTEHGGRGGAIVNISSAAARLGGAGRNVHYASTKGAIEAFTNGAAQEVAREGIRVNAVSPGVIDTEIHSPERISKVLPTLPMGRLGATEEVAEAVLWLASDQASYVSGAVVGVSGAR